MPIYCEINEIYPLSQFDKEDLEFIGLLKFDFLGLKTLTIIYSSIIDINVKRKKFLKNNIDIDDIPLNDTKTFLYYKNLLLLQFFN